MKADKMTQQYSKLTERENLFAECSSNFPLRYGSRTFNHFNFFWIQTLAAHFSEILQNIHLKEYRVLVTYNQTEYSTYNKIRIGLYALIELLIKIQGVPNDVSP